MIEIETPSPSDWICFGIVFLCFVVAFIWHLIVTRREMNTLPSSSRGRGFAWKAMLGRDRAAVRVLNRMAGRAFLIMVGAIVLFFVLTWLATFVSQD